MMVQSLLKVTFDADIWELCVLVKVPIALQEKTVLLSRFGQNWNFVQK